MGGRSAVLAALALWTGLLLATVAGHSVTAGPSPHGIPLAAPLAIVAVSIACGWLALRLGAGTGALALVAAIGIGGLARGQAHALRLEVQRAPFIAHSMFRIEGSIVGPPALESGSAVAVIAVSAARPALARGCRVRIRLPDGCEAEWSDRVSAIAQLTPPEAERNPGGIDARAAAASASLVATGVARYAVTRPAEGLAAWPRALVMRWRRALERTLHSALTPATAELVAPLMFGDRTAVDSDLNAAFRAAGLTHLLALSGLHVAWLASLARALAAALGAGVRGRALARGACAALYVLLAGPIPSLARAAAGELLGAAARLAQRALDPVQALAVAALTLLAMFPGWAEDLGFQLSCAATLGLVTIGARLADTRAGTRARVVTFAFGATAGAQLASLPLLLGRFHALAWTSLLSNLVAVPVTGLLLASAWIGSLLEQGCPGAGMPFLHACEPVAFALRAIVNAASRVPGALLAGGHGNAPWLAGWAAALLAVGVTPARAVLDRMRPTPAWREAAAWTGASLSAAALALALFSRPLMPRSGHTWVVVLDVGQGDAIAIALGDGWWLVDAGGRTPRVDAGQSVVLPFLRWAGVRRLENLVLTHDDGDHIGGARAVLSGVRVERVLGPAPRAAVAGPLARFPGTALSRGDTLE
ncbi:MAG: ComEC/Rec2 family competence protein, partial [Candidatus Eisenbacteria bacterium]|nr:ComEC/Rec2 family competence protein [Candidatus Eisenbacteria bacterium]